MALLTRHEVADLRTIPLPANESDSHENKARTALRVEVSESSQKDCSARRRPTTNAQQLPPPNPPSSSSPPTQLPSCCLSGSFLGAAQLETPIGRLVAYTCHLDAFAGRSARVAQFQPLLEDAMITMARGLPVVIGGDLNTHNHGLARFSQRMTGCVGSDHRSSLARCLFA